MLYKYTLGAFDPFHMFKLESFFKLFFYVQRPKKIYNLNLFIHKVEISYICYRGHGCGWQLEFQQRIPRTSLIRKSSNQSDSTQIVMKRNEGIHMQTYPLELDLECALVRSSVCKKLSSQLFIYTRDTYFDTPLIWKNLWNSILAQFLTSNMVSRLEPLNEHNASNDSRL